MKDRLVIVVIVALSLFNCEEGDEFNPSNLSEVFNLEVQNDEKPADGISKVKVFANFPSDFNTEDDGKVSFKILKKTPETKDESIIFTSKDGLDSRFAEVEITHNVAENIMVQASISIDNSLIQKETQVNFIKAYPDSINVRSSALTLAPNNFTEIELTTELIREIGNVSENAFAETIVIDTLGNNRGVFNNYKNQSDSSGIILNKFSMGTDNYEGSLFVISTTIDSLNRIKTDSLTLISKQ